MANRRLVAPLSMMTSPACQLPPCLKEDGALFTLDTVLGKQGRQRYGVHGDTYVSVVEFGATTYAASIMTFGKSADPKSKHFFDQAPLFVKGQFKASWMTLEEVRQHSESAYHPGEETSH